MRNFSTPADQELCRHAVRRVTQRLTIGLTSIIALHRAYRTADERSCQICQEPWPCRTVMLAVTAHQETAQ